jgi:hypothetical protein
MGPLFQHSLRRGHPGGEGLRLRSEHQQVQRHLCSGEGTNRSQTLYLTKLSDSSPILQTKTIGLLNFLNVIVLGHFQ